MKSLLKSTIFILLVGIFASSAHAQVPSSIDGVTVKVNPQSPAPGQEVTVSVESYNTDLNAASIVWLVDGKSAAKGVGLTSIKVNAPATGKSAKVSIAIVTTEGRQVQKEISITPGDVDLVWEGGGYNPPFFKGKSPFSYQNPLKVVAMPHFIGSDGKEIDPKTLVYKWRENDKAMQDQSGYGRQSALIKEDLPLSLKIDVQVMTRDGIQSAVSSINIVPGNPSINFYENDPLYGIFYNKALADRIALKNNEMNVLAVPYSFSGFTADIPLVYTWSINNLEQPDLSKNQSIVLRTNGETEGNSAISLDIRNDNNILQGAKAAITVFFKKAADVQSNNAVQF